MSSGDLTCECTWKSFGINIYAIQNDINRASLNIPPPHSSRDQAQNEKCEQEGVCPRSQSWPDFITESQISTDFLIPHFLISKLQQALKNDIKMAAFGESCRN